MSTESEGFKEMIDNMTTEMLICTVAAIVVVLDQLVPNSEQAITSLAGTLFDTLEGSNEQGDQSTTE